MSGMVMNHGAEVCESNVVIRVLPESWAEKRFVFFAGATPLAEQESNEIKLELLELEFLIIESGNPQKIGIIWQGCHGKFASPKPLQALGLHHQIPQPFQVYNDPTSVIVEPSIQSNGFQCVASSTSCSFAGISLHDSDCEQIVPCRRSFFFLWVANGEGRPGTPGRL